ncbi:hypothetical protein COV42_01640 [Candidatus Campbellbacteria bacterium CG11_big_fil_rev_8_21_14_0_20_44_21]|uniref:Lipid II flippase MurJ n=1 Tax=Candidatus Campbellbacteria bacterium CG22_combo_CG10-13_8_21_14_all_43_18 TaxID=1974530 RepID=A0A2H0DYV6_9BACT|nr:MAG: hypothetical protein COW82_00235 [Candidatus Campbellbacteria bacterium CG22_combo_CG10-13_8_21_14_all_43_18]PIR24259.1 MAG: hypothetical protein COV42_01640 [Candidatus Campbellbacteria bacterium CG11_big_fil_rev_8_21_14_0_20_44_21]
MVKKVLKLFRGEIKGLHQAAYLLGLFAFLSQILGLARDRLLAHSFGAGETLDIYYAAFRLPDLIFVAIASSVSIFVLVPFLIDKLDRKKEEAKIFVDNVFSFFFALIVFASFVSFALAPALLRLLFPGFEASALDSLVGLSRIFLLSPILLGLSNLFSSITQVYKRFFVYALSPLLYNLGIILGIVFLYPAFGLSGLGLGVVFGAFLHLLIQVPVVSGSGLLPSFRLNLDLKEIFDVVKISFPRTLTLTLSNITILVLISLASVLGEGSISVFNLSFNLQSVPLSIIGVSYSVAAFPTLARFFSSGDREKFVGHIIASARHIIFWSLPVIFLFIVLRAQIVRVVLGSGQFGWEDTRLSAAALALFAVSALSQALVMLFVRGYYAAGFTKKPLIVNAFSSILTIVLAFALVSLFSKNDSFRFFLESLLRIEDLPGTSVIMLPLAYSLGMTGNLIALWMLFKKDFKEFLLPLKDAFFHSIVASFFMSFTAFYFLKIFDDVFDINTFWGILLQGLFSALAGALLGLLLLKIFKNREMEEITRFVRTKFWKVKVIQGETESL